MNYLIDLHRATKWPAKPTCRPIADVVGSDQGRKRVLSCALIIELSSTDDLPSSKRRPIILPFLLSDTLITDNAEIKYATFSDLFFEKRIGDLFEYALYKCTLYLLTYLPHFHDQFKCSAEYMLNMLYVRRHYRM